MIANIKFKDGGEYPNCYIFGVTRYSFNALLKFGNGRLCVSKKDIKSLLIKDYYHKDTLEAIRKFKYPVENFK